MDAVADSVPDAERRATTARLAALKNHGLVLLFHLAQFVFPRRPAFDALYGELSPQRRTGSAAQTTWHTALLRPRSTITRSPMFTCTRTEKPRPMRMNVIRTGHLRGTASFLTHEAPSYGQRQVDEFARQQIPLRATC